MKIFAVIFALCVAGSLGKLTDKQMQKLRTYKQSCITETGIDPVVVENAKKGQYNDAGDKLPCFFACILKKIGIMSPDGQLQEDVFRAKLPADTPKETADRIVNTCKTQVGKNACDTAAKVVTCFRVQNAFEIL